MEIYSAITFPKPSPALTDWNFVLIMPITIVMCKYIKGELNFASLINDRPAHRNREAARPVVDIMYRGTQNSRKSIPKL